MSGSNTSVQLNQNTSPGAEMWVRSYSGVPGESTDVVAEVVNLIDDQGNIIGASNPLPTSGSVSVLNPFTVDTISGSVSVQNFPANQVVSGSVSVINPTTTVTANVAGSVGAIQAGYWQVGTWPSAAVNVGQTSASTNAVPIHSGSIAPTNGILVQALSGNTASVFIGGTGVTTVTGFELQKGQATSFAVANISLLYVVGSNTSDGVCWNVT